MSTSVAQQELRQVWEPPLSKPLDEGVWQKWVAKGRTEDRRGSAALVKAATWVSIAALLAAAGLWSYLTPYDIVIRFIVAAGAIVMLLHTFHARQYAFAAVFGALALLYNPVAPVFGFSGDWQRAVVAASAAPFAASLAWRKIRKAHND
jgi:Flp pilus assembly protein TadB